MELHHYRKNPQFEGFNQEEVVIINSIIDLRSTLAQKVMIPLAKNYSLKEDQILTSELIKKIGKKNYSMIPVMSQTDKC